MCNASQALMAYFSETSGNNTSVTLFSKAFLSSYPFSHFGPHCEILLGLYLKHDNGLWQSNDDTLTHCLRRVLKLSD